MTRRRAPATSLRARTRQARAAGAGAVRLAHGRLVAWRRAIGSVLRSSAASAVALDSTAERANCRTQTGRLERTDQTTKVDLYTIMAEVLCVPFFFSPPVHVGRARALSSSAALRSPWRCRGAAEWEARPSLAATRGEAGKRRGEQQRRDATPTPTSKRFCQCPPQSHTTTTCGRTNTHEEKSTPRTRVEETRERRRTKNRRSDSRGTLGSSTKVCVLRVVICAAVSVGRHRSRSLFESSSPLAGLPPLLLAGTSVTRRDHSSLKAL